MEDLLIIDSTLRDGAHAIGHKFTAKNITDYAGAAEAANEDLIIVGHGNGLGASSLQLGRAILSDVEMLTLAKKELKHTKLGAFLIPGFGTIKNDIDPAIAAGIEVIIIASHCTEANITRQHIQYVTKKGIVAYGVLMMAHMISSSELLEQALLMQEYGVKGILLMDSAGASLPKDVKEKVGTLVRGLKIKVGFHAHNNLGMAIANSIAAIESGAKIIDATSKGLGAGAGNCQLEVLVAVLEKVGMKTNLDLYKLMDNSAEIIAKIMKRQPDINVITLTSGLTGIFSGFAPHVIKAAERFNVDVRDIFIELQKRKVVAGQEDIIIDVAMYLAEKKKANKEDTKIEALI